MIMQEPMVKFEALDLKENIFTDSFGDCSNSEYHSGLELCSCTNSSVGGLVGGDVCTDIV